MSSFLLTLDFPFIKIVATKSTTPRAKSAAAVKFTPKTEPTTAVVTSITTLAYPNVVIITLSSPRARIAHDTRSKDEEFNLHNIIMTTRLT